jgi:hypothetical protein
LKIVTVFSFGWQPIVKSQHHRCSQIV